MIIFGSFLSSSLQPLTGKGEVAPITGKVPTLYSIDFSIEVLSTMSVAGLFLAAHDLKIEWIVIKGVANFADGRETESWKQFASVMAASLTAHILSNPIVFENWPHYKGEYAVA